MDEQGSDRIAETLASMGEDLSGVDGRTLRQLERLEGAISAEAGEVERLRLELRAHGMTVSEMAKASGISRATFYNKPLLARYLEARKAQLGIKGEDKALAAAVARAEEAERKVALMTERDGELVLAAANRRRLERRVESLEKALEEANARRATGQSGRIIEFGKGGRSRR